MEGRELTDRLEDRAAASSAPRDGEPEEEVLSPVDEEILHAPPEPPPAPVEPAPPPGLPRSLWGGLAAAAVIVLGVLAFFVLGRAARAGDYAAALAALGMLESGWAARPGLAARLAAVRDLRDAEPVQQAFLETLPGFERRGKPDQGAGGAGARRADTAPRAGLRRGAPAVGGAARRARPRGRRSSSCARFTCCSTRAAPSPS
jgi:hypothetical protein